MSVSSVSNIHRPTTSLDTPVEKKPSLIKTLFLGVLALQGASAARSADTRDSLSVGHSLYGNMTNPCPPFPPCYQIERKYGVEPPSVWNLWNLGGSNPVFFAIANGDKKCAEFAKRQHLSLQDRRVLLEAGNHPELLLSHLEESVRVNGPICFVSDDISIIKERIYKSKITQLFRNKNNPDQLLNYFKELEFNFSNEERNFAFAKLYTVAGESAHYFQLLKQVINERALLRRAKVTFEMVKFYNDNKEMNMLDHDQIKEVLQLFISLKGDPKQKVVIDYSRVQTSLFELVVQQNENDSEFVGLIC